MSSYEVKCVTYNIGGIPDTQRLIGNAKGVIQDGVLSGIRDKLNSGKRLDDSDNAYLMKHYTTLAEREFKQLVSENHDIISLQEVNLNSRGQLKTEEHRKILEVLKANNYAISGQGCTAIAYKVDKYQPVNTTYQDQGTTILTLKDIVNNKTLRVFSDQVAGFNLTSPNAKEAAAGGDKDLKTTIASVSRSFWRTLGEFFCGIRKDDPDLEIYTAILMQRPVILKSIVHIQNG